MFRIYDEPITRRTRVTGANWFMGNAAEFTDTNFKQEVLESRNQSWSIFGRRWCGPCRMVGPVIEQLAAEYQGSVKIGKLNTDDSPSTAASYGIASIPTLMIFKGGEVVDRMVGVPTKARLQEAFDAAKG